MRNTNNVIAICSACVLTAAFMATAQPVPTQKDPVETLLADSKGDVDDVIAAFVSCTESVRRQYLERLPLSVRLPLRQRQQVAGAILRESLRLLTGTMASSSAKEAQQQVGGSMAVQVLDLYEKHPFLLNEEAVCDLLGFLSYGVPSTVSVRATHIARRNAAISVTASMPLRDNDTTRRVSVALRYAPEAAGITGLLEQGDVQHIGLALGVLQEQERSGDLPMSDDNARALVALLLRSRGHNRLRVTIANLLLTPTTLSYFDSIVPELEGDSTSDEVVAKRLRELKTWRGLLRKP